MDDVESRRQIRLAPPPECEAEFISFLESLLADAKRGELLGLWCVRIWKNAEYDWRRCGWCPRAERALGELKLLEFEITKQIWDER